MLQILIQPHMVRRGKQYRLPTSFTGEDYIIGEGDEMERNPAYQTSASLIPSSSNPSYAGLNMTANTQVVSAL